MKRVSLLGFLAAQINPEITKPVCAKHGVVKDYTGKAFKCLACHNGVRPVRP